MNPVSNFCFKISAVPERFMSVFSAQRSSTGGFSSIPVVLFYSPRISKCLKTLFLLSPHICFIIGFILDVFVARNDSWMS